MRDTLNDFFVRAVESGLAIFRAPVLNDARVWAILGQPALQNVVRRVGARRARTIARQAERRCPAYRQFLAENGVTRGASFDSLPVTSKENYVRRYSIEDRCLDGCIPARGVVIDESSGSSGAPNNWVRGPGERAAVRRLLQHGWSLTFRDQGVFLLNCFALGPWATGMNVSMSLVDRAILKSIGPDKAKLEATLTTFGKRYRYVIAGYPPFIKDFLDNTCLDLSGHEIHLIVGGEGLSEGLRTHFLRHARSVVSSYGASDLEINIGVETERTIWLRRHCASDPRLCRELFGRDEPPMIFQYNPLDYLIETNDQSEMLFTLLRSSNVAPKIRYNLKDIGGTTPWSTVAATLEKHGVAARTIPSGLSFPLLWVFGRGDLSMPFYGCKIMTGDLDGVLWSDVGLRAAFHSFRLRKTSDGALNESLVVMLERSASGTPCGLPDTSLSEFLYRGLSRVNQDFREVSRLFGPERIVVEIHNFQTGPFAGRDIRIKNKYLES